MSTSLHGAVVNCALLVETGVTIAIPHCEPPGDLDIRRRWCCVLAQMQGACPLKIISVAYDGDSSGSFSGARHKLSRNSSIVIPVNRSCMAGEND